MKKKIIIALLGAVLSMTGCSFMTAYEVASIFFYYYIDLSYDSTAEDLLYIQTQDIMDKRDHVEVVEDLTTRESGNKTIKSLLLSAEKEGSKNYYYANLVEFGDEADQFAWVMFTVMPSDMDKYRAEFDGILDSMEYTEQGETL